VPSAGNVGQHECRIFGNTTTTGVAEIYMEHPELLPEKKQCTVRDCNLDTCGAREEGSVVGGTATETDLPTAYSINSEHIRDRLCGLVVRVSGYRSRGPGLDSRGFQIF
jgi:hypothetical protein